MTTALEELLFRHVEAGTIPGAVAVLASPDDAEMVATGMASVGGPPMRDDAIMRIQSMTKVITSVAALRRVEAGQLGLDDSVEEWLPELATRRVLSHPTAALDDTVPARRPITLRHLLTNTSGYGMAITESPLQRAMAGNATEAGPEPVTLGADEWLARLGSSPSHSSQGKAGDTTTRSQSSASSSRGSQAGRSNEHLTQDLFERVKMTDTALWVPQSKLDRLPAAYRHDDDGFIETEPAGGGFYAGPPPFDVSHAELVSTAGDYHRSSGCSSTEVESTVTRCSQLTTCSS